MSESENVRTVRKVMDAFNRRDLDTAAECWAPEAEFYPVVAAALGRSQPFRGEEGMREYFRMTEELWEWLTVDVVQVEEAGDGVVCLGEVHGQGPGGAVDTTAIWTWRVRDGLIVEGRVHSDTAVARSALGLTGEPAASGKPPAAAAEESA